MTEQKFNLADADSFDLTRDPSDGPYRVVLVEPREYLELRVGYTRGQLMSFTHPNATKTNKVFEFKHYRQDGGKYWTQEPGIEFTFRVPRRAIWLMDELTWSYPVVEIGGKRITLNTSGGTYQGGGWADWISPVVSTLVNMPSEALWAIATNSIPIHQEEA